MEPIQQPPVTASSPGIFGTKIPSTVAYAIGVLLFFLPFMEIKCNNTTLQQVSGFQLATGFSVKDNSSGNSFMNDFNTKEDDGERSGKDSKSEKKEANMFAIVALGLGVLGLLLSLAKAKSAVGTAMFTGLLSAGALIGLMIDVKKKVKLEMPEKGNSDDGNNFLNGMSKIGDNMGITVDFTPWFYVAVIAFLAAAFFSYRRMVSAKT